MSRVRYSHVDVSHIDYIGLVYSPSATSWRWLRTLLSRQYTLLKPSLIYQLVHRSGDLYPSAQLRILVRSLASYRFKSIDDNPNFPYLDIESKIKAANQLFGDIKYYVSGPTNPELLKSCIPIFIRFLHGLPIFISTSSEQVGTPPSSHLLSSNHTIRSFGFASFKSSINYLKTLLDHSNHTLKM
jgi:hypothetical protein